MQILLPFNILFFSAPFFSLFAHANFGCHDKIYIWIEMKGDDQVFLALLTALSGAFTKSPYLTFFSPTTIQVDFGRNSAEATDVNEEMNGVVRKMGESIFKAHSSPIKFIFMSFKRSKYCECVILLLRTSFRLIFFSGGL